MVFKLWETISSIVMRNPWDDEDEGLAKKGRKQKSWEDIFSKKQNKPQFFIPKGFDKNFFVFGGVLLLLLWVGSGLYRIAEGEQGAVLRFGRWHRTVVDTGLGWHIPAPFEKIMIKKITEVNRINIGFTSFIQSDAGGQAFMLTGDENILDVNMTIFWFINDLKKYLFRAADPELTVQIAAESAVREVIAQTPMELALTKGKSEIVEKVRKLLQRIVDEYQIGIQILKVDLQKVDAPGPVIDAFRDVQSARADQERMINEATGYRDSIVPQAGGEAEQVIQEAKAERDRLIAESEGESEHFRLVVKEYKAAPSLTTKRMYLETMGNILSKVNKVIVDGKAKGLLPHIPIPALGGSNKDNKQ